jgi:hypothetical protein
MRFQLEDSMGHRVLDVVAGQLNIEFLSELDLLQGGARATVVGSTIWPARLNCRCKTLALSRKRTVAAEVVHVDLA